MQKSGMETGKNIYIYGKQKTQIKMVQPGSNISAILITEKD